MPFSSSSSSYPSSITILYSNCVQRLPDLRNNYVPEGPARVDIECIWSAMCVCTRESSRSPNSNIMVPDRPQHILPTASVVAQEYSSAIRLTALTLPHGKIRHALKKYCFIFLLFKKLRKLWSFWAA